MISTSHSAGKCSVLRWSSKWWRSVRQNGSVEVGWGKGLGVILDGILLYSVIWGLWPKKKDGVDLWCGTIDVDALRYRGMIQHFDTSTLAIVLRVSWLNHATQTSTANIPVELRTLHEMGEAMARFTSLAVTLVSAVPGNESWPTSLFRRLVGFRRYPEIRLVYRTVSL